MGRFISRVAFCVATELVALVIVDKIVAAIKTEKTVVAEQVIDIE